MLFLHQNKPFFHLLQDSASRYRALLSFCTNRDGFILDTISKHARATAERIPYASSLI